MISAELLKQLREDTGIAMIDCKKALEEANGDIKRAKEILRERGKESIKDRTGKAASQGLVASYIHSSNKVGVLLQINCETDFVAKSNDFQNLGHELCLQIVAAKPLFVRPEDINEEVLAQEKKIYEKQMAESGKPTNILEKVIEGKLAKYKQEVCLLNQVWIKDSSKTIESLVDEVRRKTGERVEVAKFSRFEI